MSLHGSSLWHYLELLASSGQSAETSFLQRRWNDLRNLQAQLLAAVDSSLAEAPPPAAGQESPELFHLHRHAVSILCGQASPHQLQLPTGLPSLPWIPFHSTESPPDYLLSPRLRGPRLHREALRMAAAKDFHPHPDFRVLDQAFFRNRRAYLIARDSKQDHHGLFLLAVTMDGPHPVIDAVLTTEAEITPVFEFSRTMLIPLRTDSFSFLDPLEAMLSDKPRWQLLLNTGFTVLGRAFLLRELRRHLQQTREQFRLAPGTPGMVMVVFDLPTFPVVFKVIKDVPDPPKSIGRHGVLAKYRQVAEHDRVGRMADSHLFENLPFPLPAFSPELLRLLKERAPSALHIHQGTAFFREVLVERKMVPLDLLLTESANDPSPLLDEFADALRDMAWANIFPGDLLPKNFGVTRFGRVVFYDYDEVDLLTECHFRRLPEDESPLSLGPRDIFPEEWPRFLFRSPESRAYFCRRHGDLFDPAFWNRCRSHYAEGNFVDLFPYHSQR